MKKSFNFILSCVCIATFSLSFLSCSDDDNTPTENEKEVKLLPIKITLMENDELYAESVLTYNEKNQLTQFVYEDGETFVFEYDEQGRLMKFGDNNEYKSYIYSENTVTYSTNSPDDETITLDSNGLIEKIVTSYDNKEYLFEFNKDVDFLKNTLNGNTVISVTYQDYFSPFCNMSLPAHFMLHDDYWGIQTSGLHMPYMVDDREEEKTTYKVLESQNNYPTKIEEIGGSNFVYTIQYKAMN